MKWIPVTERLPDGHAQVFVWFSIGHADTAQVFNEKYWFNTLWARDIGVSEGLISHWAEIEPPDAKPTETR